MTEKTVPTYSVDIFIAGDAAEARRICRQFCLARGFCVTITETEFVYTGGAESGVRVGCINYPRFPSEPEAIWLKAYDLAKMLRDGLCQHSFCMVAPDKTYWETCRE